MFRLNVLKATNTLNHSCVNLQFVRWAKRPARKPIGAPTAKSKLFRVPVRPSIAEDENEELKRITNNYRTQMKSLRKYLASRYIESDVTELADEQRKQIEFEKDFVLCAKLNEEWNNEIAVERKEFFENELLKGIEVAQQRLQIRHQVLEERQNFAEEIVRKVKVEAKSFITRENIDAAIELAMENPTDYNFSIDLEGNRYYGRETKPDKNVEQISVKQ